MKPIELERIFSGNLTQFFYFTEMVKAQETICSIVFDYLITKVINN